MAYVNHVILMGDVINEPRLYYSGEKSFPRCDFMLRTSYWRFSKKRSYIHLVRAIGDRGAVFIKDRVQVGDKIVVTGFLEPRSYLSQGSRHTTYNVIIERFQFVHPSVGRRVLKDHVLIRREDWDRWQTMDQNLFHIVSNNEAGMPDTTDEFPKTEPAEEDPEGLADTSPIEQPDDDPPSQSEGSQGYNPTSKFGDEESWPLSADNPPMSMSPSPDDVRAADAIAEQTTPDKPFRIDPYSTTSMDSPRSKSRKDKPKPDG